LPDIARSLGKSITEFKKGIKEAESEVRKSPEDTVAKSDDSAKPEPPRG